MAKKDDFDFDDDDLDFGMDDFDGLSQPKGAMGVMRNFTKSFGEAAFNEVKDGGKVLSRVKQTLPSKADKAVELLDYTSGNISSLYNIIVKETRQPLRYYRRAASRLLKRDGEEVPKGIRGKLYNLVKLSDESGESRRGFDKDSADAAEITSTLSEIFNKTVEVDQDRINEERSRSTLKDAVDKKRFDTNLSQLVDIKQYLHRQVSYQDQVTAKFQAKSLELQYRQLFVSRDIKEITAAGMTGLKEELLKIVENTGLSDHQKMKQTEGVGSKLRRRITGLMPNNVRDWHSDFRKNLSKNLNSAVKDKARAFADLLSQGEMLGGMADGLEGISKSSLVGSLAGSSVTDYLIKLGLKPVRKHLEKNEKLNSILSSTSQSIDNLPRILNTWKNKREFSGDAGVFGRFLDFLSEIVPGIQSRSDLSKEGIEALEEPAVFNVQARRSIVEVIPGYLSRILAETKIIRAEGFKLRDPKPGEYLKFNYDSGKFTNTAGLIKTVRKHIFDEQTSQSSLEELDQVHDILGISKAFSGDKDEAAIRKAVSKVIIDIYKSGEELDVTKLASSEAFRGTKLTQEQKSKIADVIRDEFNVSPVMKRDGTIKLDSNYDEVEKAGKDIETRRKLVELSKSFNNLKSAGSNPRGKLQSLIKTGYNDALLGAGLIKKNKDGSLFINQDKITETFITGDSSTDEDYLERTNLARKVGIDRNKKAAEEMLKMKESKAFNWITSKASDIKKYFIPSLKNGLSESEIARGDGKLFTALKGKIDSTIDYIYDFQADPTAREEAIFTIKDGIDNILNTVQNPTLRKIKIQELLEETKSTIKTTKDKVVDTVSNEFESGGEGIKSAVNDIKNKSKDFISKYDKPSFVKDIVTQYEKVAGSEKRLHYTNQQLNDFTKHIERQQADNKMSPEKVVAYLKKKRLSKKQFMYIIEKLNHTKTFADYQLEKVKELERIANRFEGLTSTNHRRMRETAIDVIAKDLKLLIDSEGYDPKNAIRHIKRQKLTPQGLQYLFLKLKSFYSETGDNMDAIVHKDGVVINREMSEKYRDELIEKGAVDTVDGLQNVTVNEGEMYISPEVLKELGGEVNKYLSPDAEAQYDKDGVRLLSKGTTRKEARSKRARAKQSKSKESFFSRVTSPFRTSETAKAIKESLDNSETVSKLKSKIPTESFKRIIKLIKDQKYDEARNIAKKELKLKGATLDNFMARMITEGNTGIIKGFAKGGAEKVTTFAKAGYDRVSSFFGGGESDSSTSTTGGLKKTNTILQKILNSINAVGVIVEKGISGSNAPSVFWKLISAPVGVAASIVGNMAKGLGGLYGGALKGTGHLFAGAGKAAGGLIGGVGKFLGLGIGAAGRGIFGADSVLTSSDIGPMDIYTKSERKTPVLTADGMRKGIYVDSATNTIIRSVKDLAQLKGDVYRKVKKGKKWDTELVVTAKELSKGIFNRFGSRIGDPSIMTRLANLAGKAIKLPFTVLGSPFRMMGAMYRYAERKTNRPQDIYVGGESSPRLLATVMANGGYLNKSDKSTITTHKDIKSDVIDLRNNVVLKLSEIAEKGIFAKNGKSLNFGLRQLQRLLAPFKLAAKLGIGAVKGAWKMTKGIAKGVGKVALFGLSSIVSGSFKGTLSTVPDAKIKLVKNEDGSYEGVISNDGTNMIIKALMTIKDAIQSRASIRLSKDKDGNFTGVIAKHGIANSVHDKSGDGLRDGSWLSRIFGSKSKKEKEKNEVKSAEKEVKEKGFLARILGGGANLLKLKVLIAGLVGGALFTETGQKITKQIVSALAKGGKIAGSAIIETMSKKENLKYVAGALGLIFSKTIATSLLKLVGWAGGALASKIAGSATMVAAKASGGALLAKAGVAVGGVLGGLVSAPVLLGVAVVGGGYLIWRHYEKKKATEFEYFRFLQYGINTRLKENKVNVEKVAKLRWLEDYTFKNVNITEDTLRIPKKYAFEIYKQFNVDVRDDLKVSKFNYWLEGRFLPVMKANAVSLNQIKNSNSLNDIDKLSRDEKSFFLDGVINPQRTSSRVKEEPYEVTESPFSEDPITIPKAFIDEEYKRLKEKYSKKVPAKMDFYERNDREQKEITKARNTVYENFFGSTSEELNKEIDQFSRIRAGRKKQMSSIDSVVNGEQANTYIGGKRGTINTLQAVRMYAYGLSKEMGKEDADRVNLLLDLEYYLLGGHIQKTNQGYQFNGNLREIMDVFGSKFGFGGWLFTHAYESNFVAWFNIRFLKVFLTYLNIIAKNDNAFITKYKMMNDEKSTGYDKTLAFNAATVLQALKDSETDTSIWDSVTNPWVKDSGLLNRDPESIMDFITYLENEAKSDNKKIEIKKHGKGGELEGGGNKVVSQAVKFSELSSRRHAMEQALANQRKVETESATTPVVATPTPPPAPTVSTPTTPVNRNNVTSLSDYVGKQQESYYKEYSANVDRASEATGMINSIPMPRGDGSWKAHKETIIAAAKLAGVDPGLMATIAAIESNFNSRAKNPRSNASGLFQFIPRTWNTLLRRYGSKYGIAPHATPFDPRASALLAGELIKEEERNLQGVLKGPMTDTALYAAHFFGAGAVKDFFRADPNELGEKVFPKQATANPGIFRRNGKPSTIEDIYNIFENKVSGARNLYADQARELAGLPVKDIADSAYDEPKNAQVADSSSAPKTLSDRVGSRVTSYEVPKVTPVDVVSTGGDISSATPLRVGYNKEVIEARGRINQAAKLRDEEEQERLNNNNAILNSIAGILNASLNTQKSMDSRLKSVVDILKEQSDKKEKVLDNEPVTGELLTATGRNMKDPRKQPSSVVELRKTS